jgi:predicted ATP-grasp superfamily ATP-dependent carboligase
VYLGPAILITDGTERAALAAARTLVAAGYKVHVAAARRLSLASVSRAVHSCQLTTDPHADPTGYAAELGGIIATRGIAVLLPITDVSVEAVLEHRHLLPRDVAVPYPALPVYRRASDKLQLLDLARSAGFAVPETVVFDAPDERRARETDVYPAVVKPHRSVVTHEGRRRRIRVAFVSDAEACSRVLTALPPAAFPVLLQRRVSGTGEGFFALRWDGDTVASFAHRRLREKPPAGGESTYRESIAPDPQLVSAGQRLLDALDWTGVAMIECKRDPDTGGHVIMEVNGRFWGSLQLAIDAGVDFPTLLVRCALGDVPPPQNEYRIGVRSRWFWGDVDNLHMRLTPSADPYMRLTPPAAVLQRAGSGAARLRAVMQFLAFRPGRDRCEVWRWRDPAPFLLETAQRLHLMR